MPFWTFPGLKDWPIGPESALTGRVPEIRIRGSFFAEGYPSGQREQTVNLPAYAFVGSNPTPSTTRGSGLEDPADSVVRIEYFGVILKAGVVQW